MDFIVLGRLRLDGRDLKEAKRLVYEGQLVGITELGLIAVDLEVHFADDTGFRK
ncbi:hypothetical protein [Roseateles amylovorans]|uniref:Uncharacterized protein n=1 Tax=Roseateles amylovorans TaxID=2978473 RepID=A0ABY6AYP4_9BURK|nr:hypothetical protein [Roseateles amylovorans]UXH76205.1 hypothetical protein N4261_14120 [Roseateles amylovorans]